MWRFFAPFLISDGVLLGAAALLFRQAHRPMQLYEVAAFATCVVLGACLAVWPFIAKHKEDEHLAGNAELKGTLEQIQDLEKAAGQIANATAQWQGVQEHSVQTVNAAREISERMTSETKEFFAFVEKAQDAEKGHLKLELEKLKRAEGDWLQVVVHVMDHVYALQQAGSRSGQPALAEQLSTFQNACRDVVRRVGLVPMVVPPGTPFDPRAHQAADNTAKYPEGSKVVDTLGTGYSYQGQVVRLPVVFVHPASQGDGGNPGSSASARQDSAPTQAATGPATPSEGAEAPARESSDPGAGPAVGPGTTGRQAGSGRQAHFF